MFVQNFKSTWNNSSGPIAVLRPNLMLMDVPPFLHSASTCCLLACFFYSIHSAYMAMYQWYELCFEIMKRPRYTSWLSFRLCWFSFDWSPWTAIRQWTNDKIYPENNYTWSRSIDTDIIQDIGGDFQTSQLNDIDVRKKNHHPETRWKWLFPKADPQVCLGVSWSNQSRVTRRIVPWVNDLLMQIITKLWCIYFTLWNPSPQTLLVWAYLLTLALSQSYILKKMVA